MSDAERENQPQPDLPELPPIPDGGLRQHLPAWLAAPPSRPAKMTGTPAPLDLTNIAAADDLPPWLQELSRRIERNSPETAAAAETDRQTVSAETPVETTIETASETADEPLPRLPVADPASLSVADAYTRLVESPVVPVEIPAAQLPPETDRRIVLLLTALVIVIAVLVVVVWF